MRVRLADVAVLSNTLLHLGRRHPRQPFRHLTRKLRASPNHGRGYGPRALAPERHGGSLESHRTDLEDDGYPRAAFVGDLSSDLADDRPGLGVAGGSGAGE